MADCRERGGVLAAPRDASQINKLMRMANGAWIGINDQAKENRFTDSKGRVMTLAHYRWIPGQPDNHGRPPGEDCLMVHHGKLNDDRCERPRRYVCALPCSGQRLVLHLHAAVVYKTDSAEKCIVQHRLCADI